MSYLTHPERKVVYRKKPHPNKKKAPKSAPDSDTGALEVQLEPIETPATPDTVDQSKAPPPAWLMEDFNSTEQISRSRYRGVVANQGRAKANGRTEQVFMAPKDYYGPKDRQAEERDDDDFQSPIIKFDTTIVNKRSYGAYRSPSMRAAVCAFARSGASEVIILQLMGISHRQLHLWFKADPEFHRNYNSCRGAWAHSALSRMLDICERKMDWKGYWAILEKMYPDEISQPRPSTEVDSEASSVPTNLDPAAVLKRLRELTAKAEAALATQQAVTEPTEPQEDK